MKYGFPFDEITPISCEPLGPDFDDYENTVRNDARGNISLMVLDNIDTLIIFERWDELEYILKYLLDNKQDFFNLLNWQFYLMMIICGQFSKLHIEHY